MQFTELSYTFFTGRPDSCSRFPGVTRLPSGKLVAIYDDGIDPDSPLHEMRIATSTDDGATWQDGGVMYVQADLGLPHRFTENCKPVAVGGDELVSVGLGFMRDRPDLGLADYAMQFGHFPLSKNTFSRSTDGGATWSLPTFIAHAYDTALELSGPPMWCAPEKTLLAFGPPFVLQGHPQRGVCLASEDGGATWREQGCFFASPHIAPWEVRAIRIATGRIWLVMWSYDLEAKCHLPNHVTYSDDLGRTWSAPMDTGVRGQAANLFELDGGLHLLYTRREGDDPGIFAAPLTLAADGKSVAAGESTAFWRVPGMATPDGRIEKQFRNLKFGQPSMTKLTRPGEWLLMYWSCEEGQYAIRCRVLKF